MLQKFEHEKVESNNHLESEEFKAIDETMDKIDKFLAKSVMREEEVEQG